MIKRNTALLFILLANIILLAHAAIPHHHHKGQVCIESSPCETDCESHEHDATKNDHEHNCNTVSCVLIQDVILPSNYINQVSKSFNYPCNQPNFEGSQAILFNSGLIRFIPPNLPIKLIPLISSTYSCFVRTGLGSRAPPIV